MSDGTKTGLELAMAEAAEADEPEQLDMLGMPTLAEAQEAMFAARRGAGRPKGARNRRTEATATYLLARHGNPVEGLLTMGLMGVEEMSKRLGCTLIEAWQEKRICLAAAAPYLVQKQPMAVNLTNHQHVQLVVEASPEVAELLRQSQGEGEAVTLIDLIPGEGEDDQ